MLRLAITLALAFFLILVLVSMMQWHEEDKTKRFETRDGEQVCVLQSEYRRQIMHDPYHYYPNVK